MSAPWKKNQTTLDKVEERVTDWLDQLKLDERVGDLKDQIKDLKLDERAVDLKDQIASSELLNDIKDQIKSSERLDNVRDQVPGVTPVKKSHKRRNVALLALVGAGVGAVAYLRLKAAGKTAEPPTYAPPAAPTAPTPEATGSSAT